MSSEEFTPSTPPRVSMKSNIRDVSPSKKMPLIPNSSDADAGASADASAGAGAGAGADDLHLPKTNSAIEDVARIEAKYSHNRHTQPRDRGGDGSSSDRKGKTPSRCSRGMSFMSSASAARGFTSEGAYEDFSKSSKGLLYSLIAIFMYLALGTIIFGVWGDWNAADALYFTVATFTTVGYGDLSPQTPGQRVFGIFFISIGIAVLGGVALGIVFDSLFNSFENATKKRKDMTQSTFMSKFKVKVGNMTGKHAGTGAEAQSVEVTYNDGVNEKGNSEGDEEKVEEQQFWKGLTTQLFLYAVLIIVGILVPAIIIGRFEGWTFVDCIYYATATATTVGYGDLYPTKIHTRIIAVFYLPICISVMAKLFSDFTGVYLNKKAAEAQKQFMNRKLTFADLMTMDKQDDENDVEAGDGAVSYGEFLEFMLITMNKADKDDIKQIRDLYNAMDRDHDGTLTWRDLNSAYDDGTG